MVATRKLEIQITGDTTGAKHLFGKVDDAADRTESRMSRWATGIAGAVGAAFAVDKIIDWGSTLISAAEESQQVTAQTAAVIKSMGDVAGISAEEVADLAEAISLKTGLDDEMIQSGENVLLTFGNIKDAVGEGNDIFTRATTVATDMSVALGQDLQSSITQVGKALNDPIAGLSALSRVGVQFSDDQKAVIESLVASGDTLGAQKIILEELERQFGGSAEAQATASDKLRVAWGNVQEQLGTALLPIFEKVATWLAETLPGAIDTAITWIKENEDTVKNLAIAFGIILVGAITAYTVAAALAAVATIVAAAPILLIIGLIAVLAAGLYYAYQNWGWFQTGVDGAIRGVQGIIQTIQAMIVWIERAIDAVRRLGDILGNLDNFAFPGGVGLPNTSGVSLTKGVGRNIPRAAEGGFVTRPTLALVGESGPEAIVPLGRFGGVGGNTYITEIHTAGVISERQLIDIINEGQRKGYRLQDRGRDL